MAKQDWQALSDKLGAQLPPVRQGELAPRVLDPRCSHCGKRRKVGMVTRDAILCVACVRAMRELGQLDDEGEGDGDG